MVEPKQFFPLAGLVVVAVVTWFAVTLVDGNESPRELYESAKQYEQSADFTQAIDLYQEIVKNHPDSHFARNSSSRLEKLEM